MGMHCIQALFRQLGLRGPKIVLTDRALAVINALQDVFPDTKHLLCFWHVNKAVQAYCQLAFETEEEWEQFYAEWLALVNSPTLRTLILRGRLSIPSGMRNMGAWSTILTTPGFGFLKPALLRHGPIRLCILTPW